MTSVRIYVEGGGDASHGRRLVRQAFSQFLREFQGNMPRIIACGSREETYQNFLRAVKTYPDTFVILLVDAECAVVSSSTQHLMQHDGWAFRGINDDQVHLMVQAVEAWLIADREALKAYYGQEFNENALPTRPPEDIPKNDLKSALARAARNTAREGYHEIQDCPKILRMLDPRVVRSKCPHCRDLFNAICDALNRPHLP